MGQSGNAAFGSGVAFALRLAHPVPGGGKVKLPKNTKFAASYYNEKELGELFTVVKGSPMELGVIMSSYYGLRRSEVVGLKWDAIDFENKTITIRHIVTEVNKDGKNELVQKDRTKTKSSYRTLPLVGPFEELLLRIKAEQARWTCSDGAADRDRFAFSPPRGENYSVMPVQPGMNNSPPDCCI